MREARHVEVLFRYLDREADAATNPITPISRCCATTSSPTPVWDRTYLGMQIRSGPALADFGFITQMTTSRSKGAAPQRDGRRGPPRGIRGCRCRRATASCRRPRDRERPRSFAFEAGGAHVGTASCSRRWGRRMGVDRPGRHPGLLQTPERESSRAFAVLEARAELPQSWPLEPPMVAPASVTELGVIQFEHWEGQPPRNSTSE